jgi:hypothetical protein
MRTNGVRSLDAFLRGVRSQVHRLQRETGWSPAAVRPSGLATAWASASVEPNLWPNVLLACLRLSRGVEMISAAQEYRKKAAACLQLLAHQHLPLVMPVCIRQTAPIRVPDKRQLEQRFTLELFRDCKLVRHEPRLEFRQGCKSVNVSHRVDCGLTALSPE